MIEGWLQKIAEAQLTPTTIIGGAIYRRVRFDGLCHGDPYSTCPDCGVEPGQFHVHSCDQERCPKCGGQAISCACFGDEDEDAC
jgi:hypothetical protein